MLINDKQVVIRSRTTNYADLAAFMARQKVIGIPFVDTQEVAVSSAQFVLLDSSFISGNIALGTSSTENGGISMAALAGAVGTAANTNITDTFGNVLNLVDIRDDATHDPIIDGNGRKVWGLVQAASTASDGDAIAAAASENCQMSFVVYGADGTITLTTVNDTIEFQVNKLYYESQMPTLWKEGGVIDRDVINLEAIEPNIRKFVVTTAFVADEVITLSTGAGATAGVATDTGDTVTLAASASAFNDENRQQVFLNGVRATKGVEATWDSTDSLHFSIPLYVDDRFEVQTENQ